MSAPPAPVPASAPPVSRTARGLLAVLLAVAVVAGVWQGFGLLGFGTDLHVTRAGAALGAAFVGALVIVSRARRAVRLFALLAALGGAATAWWFVPEMDDWLPLGEADARRAALEAEMKAPLLDAPERGKDVSGRVSRLQLTYPELARELGTRRDKWVGAAEGEYKRKLEELAPNDFAGARKLSPLISELPHLRSQDESLAIRYSLFRGWEVRAVTALDTELRAIARGDWDGFALTAPGRKEFGELTDASALAEPEADWVNRTARAELLKNPFAGSEHWAAVERRLLELSTLATDDNRFSAARLSLFDRAHEAAQRAATKHIEAREYDAAFALSRAHAVRWNTTAALFGEGETKKLDKLRDACAVLARLAEIAGPPDEPAPAPREREIAPPPRAKP